MIGRWIDPAGNGGPEGRSDPVPPLPDGFFRIGRKYGSKSRAVTISRYQSTPSRYRFYNQRISPVAPSSARVEL